MLNFGDLINIDGFEKRDIFKKKRGNIGFFCKNCKKIVEISRPNKKGYNFICKECNKTNIAVGTQESLKEKYKII